MPNKKILILHGWESNPDEHWYGKAREKFEELDYEVVNPKMPGAYFPKLEEWLKVIEQYHLDENWILIGHSLGGVAILKYLENAKTSVSKVVLIATPFEPMKFNPIANFFTKDIDFENIKTKAKEFILIYEDEDFMVPFSHGKNYEKNLGAKLIIKKGSTHCDFLDPDWLAKQVEL